MRELKQLAITDPMYRDATVCKQHCVSNVQMQIIQGWIYRYVGKYFVWSELIIVITRMNILMSLPQAMSYSL